jgi:TPR repeat protein
MQPLSISLRDSSLSDCIYYPSQAMTFPILHEGIEYSTSPQTQKGIELMDNSKNIKEYRSGVALIMKAAQGGCPHANYIMGRIYMHNLSDTGVFVSVSKAKSHFQVAAEQGHPFGIMAYEENKNGYSCTTILIAMAIVVGMIYIAIKTLF